MAIVNLSGAGSVEFQGAVLAVTYRPSTWDDSDEVATVWHDGAPKEVLCSSTRFGAPTWGSIEVEVDATPEVVASYQGWKDAESRRLRMEADSKRVLTPQPHDLQPGIKVRTLRDSKSQQAAQTTCDRCNGSGKWVNPRNEHDARECFACRGAGIKVGGKLTGDNGKPVWRKLPAGTTGEVMTWESYGTFYRNGYNKPDRENTTVRMRLETGEVVPVKLEALRLDREPIQL
jgi:hypothetical protein